MSAEAARPEAAARLALFELYRAQRASVWIDATGSSMRPWIREGTSLLVDFGAHDARVGEIAVFAQGTRIVAHRIVRRFPGLDGTPVLVTKGDSTLHFDRPLPASELLGVVHGLRRTPGGRVATRTLGSRRGEALALASLASGRLYGTLQMARNLLRTRGGSFARRVKGRGRRPERA